MGAIQESRRGATILLTYTDSLSEDFEPLLTPKLPDYKPTAPANQVPSPQQIHSARAPHHFIQAMSALPKVLKRDLSRRIRVDDLPHQPLEEPSDNALAHRTARLALKGQRKLQQVRWYAVLCAFNRGSSFIGTSGNVRFLLYTDTSV